MSQNKIGRFGPIALTNAAANYLNPPTGVGGVGVVAANQYILLKHLRFVNKTGAPATFSGYIGASLATAAGTEFAGNLQSVPAQGSYDWQAPSPGTRLEVADFLVMLASANATLTVQGEYEIGVTG
jgi:hypothetical protein